MSTSTLTTLIAQLEARRQGLTVAIDSLKALRHEGEGAETVTAVTHYGATRKSARTRKGKTVKRNKNFVPTLNAGTLANRVYFIVRMADHPLNAKEITQRAIEQGWTTGAKNPLSSVGSVICAMDGRFIKGLDTVPKTYLPVGSFRTTVQA